MGYDIDSFSSVFKGFFSYSLSVAKVDSFSLQRYRFKCAAIRARLRKKRLNRLYESTIDFSSVKCVSWSRLLIACLLCDAVSRHLRRRT